MRKLAALSTALLLAACGQKELADQYRSALPSAQEVTVGAPSAGQGTAARPGGAPTARVVGATAAAGSTSDYAVTSYLFATSVNTSVGLLLAQLHAVTLWPPTACADASCTWGPGHGTGDVNEWELVVRRVGEGYDYALQARPLAGGDWVPVITGQAFPGPSEHRGHGTLSIDFDQAWAGMAHGVYPNGQPEAQEDFGAVQIAYDARHDLSVQAAFINARDAKRAQANPDARSDVWYDFAGSAAGGDLHLAFRTLPLGAESESVSLHTRWAHGGNGRGDVEYLGFQAPAGPYHASECWADAAAGFALTFDTEPAFGAETACTGFPSADYLAFPASFP